MVNKKLALIFVLIFVIRVLCNVVFAGDVEIATTVSDGPAVGSALGTMGSVGEKGTNPVVTTKDIEKQENASFLEDLYQTIPGKLLREAQTRPIVTKAAGELMDTPVSRPMIAKFLRENPSVADSMDQFINPGLNQGADRKYVDLKAAIKQYKTFNEFFYRKLSKKGMDARPIAQGDNVMASPADCHMFVIPDLSQNPEFFVKGCSFNLSKFLKGNKLIKLDDPQWVKRNPHDTAKCKAEWQKRDDLVQPYKDGILLLFRLAPDDYHRYHFPFDCVPSDHVVINGRFESVNPIAYTPTDQPLTENQRHLIILNSKIFGNVLCMIVGAMMVGSINETYQSGAECQKGQEMGYFAFGGSSIVLIFKKDAIKIDQRFIDKSATLLDYEKIKGTWRKGGVVDYPETRIRVGEKIGQAVSKVGPSVAPTKPETEPGV